MSETSQKISAQKQIPKFKKQECKTIRIQHRFGNPMSYYSMEL